MTIFNTINTETKSTVKHGKSVTSHPKNRQIVPKLNIVAITLFSK